MLQVAPAPATPVALVGTFLLGALFYALTAHVAARFVLGDVQISRALLVGPVPAFTTVALARRPVVVILGVGLLADALAIRLVYRLGALRAAAVAAVHYAVTVLVVLVISSLVALLSTAPA